MLSKRLALAAIGVVTLCAGMTAMAVGEGNLPQVMTDQIEWDGGLLDIPVDFGAYSPEDLGFEITAKDSSGNVVYDNPYPVLSKTEEGIVTFSLIDSFFSCDDEQAFTQAGSYTIELEFTLDYETFTSDEFTLVVKEDSQMWDTEYVEYSFDGSEDVVLHFTNGTNNYKLQEITSFNVFAYYNDGMGPGENYSDGFTVDMDAGTVTFDKDALKAAIVDTIGTKDDLLRMDIALNVYAVTEDGEEIAFNRVNEPGSDYITTTSIWLNITDLDFNSGSGEEPKPEEPEPSAEFVGINTPGIQVAGKDANVISSSALDYIQKNFQAEIGNLGNDYQVEAQMVLTEKNTADIPADVQDALESLVENGTIGQYYDISIVADVTQNGAAVAGLEDIYIPELSDEITVTLDIPDSVPSDGVTYTMLRYHDGQASALPTSVSNGKVTFSTADFSTYALAYAEAKAPQKEDLTDEKTDTPVITKEDTENTTTPQTGDTTNIMVMMILMISSAAVVAAVYGTKRWLKK